MTAGRAFVICAILLLLTSFAFASMQALPRIHQIEGRIMSRSGDTRGIRVRLLKLPDREPVGETFSRPEGRFIFRPLVQGEYLVETYETDIFEASLTSVTIYPPAREYPMNVHALIELMLKPLPASTKAGVVAADIDVNVPKDAARHYQKGMAALDKGDSPRAIEEFRAAVERYPDYYAARLELGRELRIKKRFQEAEEVLAPLIRIAPKRAEPRIELGIALLELQRKPEAIAELENALKLQEQSWAAHLYLGWAYLERDDAKAELHFKKAVELDELKAARAHIALARLANARGERDIALAHLDAYLELAPNAHDASAVRTLAARLRTGN